MPIPALVQPTGPPPAPPAQPAGPAPAMPRPAADFRRDLSELQHFRATIRTLGWNGLHMRAQGGAQ